MLGDSATGIPLPGHAIPYAYTASEIQDFLNMFSKDPTVSNYLWTKQPSYGVIFQPPGGYGQLLLWFDASGILHIIDVTNMGIAQQVQQAPYESPDSSLIQNIYDQIQKLIAALPSATQVLTTAEIAMIVIGLYFLTRR